MVSENGGKAKGGIGSLIVMVERNGKGEIVNYKAIQIDGDTYKEDTWYRLSYRDWETDRKSTRLNSSHSAKSRMPSSA